MPADSTLVVSGVVAMFVAFMAVLGFVWVWSNKTTR